MRFGNVRALPWFVWLLIAAVFGEIVLFRAALAESSGGHLETLSSCFFPSSETTELQKPDCGYIVVPENPGKPNATQIKLGFMRLRSVSTHPGTPLFMLAGGPGDTFIKTETLLLFGKGFLGPILGERDVIFLEQRGAPNSIPALDCPEIYGFGWTALERGYDEQKSIGESRQILHKCVADARASGVDLAQFNSLRIANDVDVARQVLGYGKIVYYGASYGAQLGQHFMRDFPESLEAVILDGTNSLSRKSWVEDRVQDVDTAIDALAAVCAADAKCAETYDIKVLIRTAIGLFEQGPIKTVYQDPSNAKIKLQLTITEADLASFIFGYRTGQTAIRSLPAILESLVANGRDSAGEILGRVKGSVVVASRNVTKGPFAMLMHMAVVCSDDPVNSRSELNIRQGASAYAIAYGKTVVDEYLELCGAVDVPALPDYTDVNVSTNVPTLVLSGRLDARTPTIRSELVARNLPRATIVAFPEGTHVQLGEINFCAAKIVQEFLANPNGKANTDCIADMPPRGFVLPDGTNSVE